MGQRAKVLYDFQGDADNGELSLTAGSIVNIFRTDVGEGWWEGECNGSSGLFPETYVEMMQGGDAGGHEAEDDWDEGGDAEEHWEEGPADDDDDDDDGPSHPPSSSSHSSRPVSTYSTSTSDATRTESMKKSVNRFSAFVKAGAEGFLLGTTKDKTIDPSAVLHVVEGMEWEANAAPYPHITVTKAGTRSKFHGIKSYEAYTVLGGSTKGNVERRHKHFQWLHERLVAKYSCIAVPPLPDKQYMPKYGETFVDKRQQKLELWVNRLCRHPVISRDELSLRHFLTPSDDKTWKNGKRKAEKDEFIGAQFFRLVALSTPCPRDAEKTIDLFANFTKDLSASLKKSMDVSLGHADRLNGGFKREYKKVGQSFEELAICFPKASATNGDSVKLSAALRHTGQIYSDIGDLWGEHPKTSELPWMDGLKEYIGLLGQFGDAISSSKSASARREEVNSKEEVKESERDVVEARVGVIHAMTLCEMNHFNRMAREDFRDYMKAYLTAQIEFHKKITERLENARSMFEELKY